LLADLIVVVSSRNETIENVNVVSLEPIAPKEGETCIILSGSFQGHLARVLRMKAEVAELHCEDVLDIITASIDQLCSFN